jgi:uncharacterized membrane protein
MSNSENPAVNRSEAMVKSADTLARVEGSAGQGAAKKERRLTWSEVMQPGSLVAGVPYNHRVISAVSYLSAFSGFWLVVPGVVFLWKGRRDRFLGFHALQAIYLQVALIPITFVGIGLAYAVSLTIDMANPKLAPLSVFLVFALAGLAFTIPSAATVWMSMCALRGQPRELPLLGRWARNVMKDV